jgi:hypothetical protein
MLATESIQGILSLLPEPLANPSGVSGRERLQSAAWLAGLCLAQTQMGLHHQPQRAHHAQRAGSSPGRTACRRRARGRPALPEPAAPGGARDR